ncbi:MAG: NAD(P)/FAD-dependent oxidoreductase [Nitrospiraceae bacterium]|nr:MAG: NAD(P)/FAD-dependent oxidoreductase [Nitrospiraceae bacterium]
MSTSQTYDVIIAGGGPAGSTAAYILAGSGLKVLIIDRSRFPRHKLCAGCITDKTVRLLKRVFGETAPDLKKKDIINFESDRYGIFCGEKLVSAKSLGVPFYFVERYTYDEFLLRRAERAGAEVIEGDGVVSLDVSVNEIRTLSGRTFTARFFIGADGVHSIMRRQFPEDIIDRAAWQNNAGTGLEIYIDRSDMKNAIDYPALYLGFINYGYAWLFPNRDRLVAGIGGLTRRNKKQFLPSFYRFLSAIGISDPGAYKVRGYAFPYGNFLSRPVYRNILLTGDAAGFADPLVGEGIYYAQRSAELAAHAIDEALEENKSDAAQRAADRYLQLLQEDIYREFLYAMKIGNLVYTRLDKFHYLPLKLLMGALGTKPLEAVQGIRSYRWLRRHMDIDT